MAFLLIKTGRKVTHVKLHWWDKTIDEHKEAWNEMHRHKVGRRARISGLQEYVIGPTSGLTQVIHRRSKLSTGTSED
ncbi:MAG: hypothetical protein PF480_01780 [Roseovarius sp.]|jgi:hypothetical protein|nr:hypothetical protein [Roseovarius sp.]